MISLFLLSPNGDKKKLIVFCFVCARRIENDLVPTVDVYKFSVDCLLVMFMCTRQSEKSTGEFNQLKEASNRTLIAN